MGLAVISSRAKRGAINISVYPQGVDYNRALQNEKLLAPLFPVGVGWRGGGVPGGGVQMNSALKF